jgi:hypothetical protein
MTTIKSQTKTYRVDYADAQGNPCTLIATVRHDDDCRNGHKSFAITGDLYEIHRQPHEPTITHASGRTLWLNACGCLHDEIAAHIPNLAPFIKWHLCSTDGPMHYLANTLYQAGDLDYDGLKAGKARELDAARKSAMWPEATDEELSAPREVLKAKLEARLPALLVEFRAAVKSLGLTF